MLRLGSINNEIDDESVALPTNNENTMKMFV